MPAYPAVDRPRERAALHFRNDLRQDLTKLAVLKYLGYAQEKVIIERLHQLVDESRGGTDERTDLFDRRMSGERLCASRNPFYL